MVLAFQAVQDQSSDAPEARAPWWLSGRAAEGAGWETHRAVRPKAACILY